MDEKKNFIIENNYLFILALAFFTLMFFQSTRLFLSALYYENLVAMGFSHTALYLFVFLLPLILVFFRLINVNIVMAASGSMIIIHRLYGSLFSEASLYILFHAVVIVSYGLYLPSFLTNYYSLNAKSHKYSLPLAVIAAPVLALIMDITFKIAGDSLDLTAIGAVDSTGTSTIHPIIISLIICIAASILLYQNYHIIQEELTSVRTTQRSGVEVSTIFPGLCFGFIYSVLFTFLGYPGIVSRWTPADYTVTVILTSMTLLILLVILQFEKITKILFLPVSQGILNAVQFFVIIDIIFLDTGAAQYLLGIAVSSLLIDMFIFYHAIGSKNYSIQYFIGITTIAIVTFIIIFVISVISLTWPYTGIVGQVLKDKTLPILTAISGIYTLSAILYSNRVRLSLIKKKWRPEV